MTGNETLTVLIFSSYKEMHFSSDSVIEKSGARVIVDKQSLEYLEGATIDFHSELIRSAFRILKNPKAESGCSCGSSFSLKIT